MNQKVFIKLEKKLAVDLKPGELFVLDLPDPDYYVRALAGPDPVVAVYLRTNVSPEEFDDVEVVVYKVHVLVTDPEEPAPPKVYPHAPPGMR